MQIYFYLVANLHVLSNKEKILLEKIGQKVKTFRLQNKLTQAQVAFELGTCTKQYQRIEYGEINTGIVNFYKLCEIFDVEIKYILV